MSIKKIQNKKLSILSLILSIIILIGTMIGVVFTLINIPKSFDESSDYTQTATIRYELSPLTYPGNPQSEIIQEQQVKETAKAFSAFLKEKSKTNYDVWYEYYHNTPSDVHAYVEANLEIPKIDNPDFDDDIAESKENPKKIDKSPILNYFDSMNNNSLTLVYKWSEQGDKVDGTKYPATYSVLPFSLLFNYLDLKSVSNTETNTYGLPLPISDAFSSNFNSMYNDMKTYIKNTTPEDPDNPSDITAYKVAPEFYIINDLSNFINVSNYYSYLYKAKDYSIEQQNIWESLMKQDSSIETFCTDLYKDQKSMQNIYIPSSKVKYLSSETPKEINYLKLLDYIDQESQGTVGYNFMNNFVVKTISSTSIDSWIPKKINDVYKNDELEETIPKVKYFWFDMQTQQASNYLLHTIKDFAFKCPTVVFDLKSACTGGNLNEQTQQALQLYEEKIIDNYQYISPNFIDTIFGSSEIVFWSFLASLIFMFLTVIPLAYQFKFNGFISWVMMLLSSSIALIMLTLNAHVISLGMVIGLFLMVMIQFITSFIIGSKIKKKSYEGANPDVAINRGFKHSLMPIFDINIISLLIGVCLVYLSPPIVSSLGILLIGGALFNLCFVFSLNWLTSYLFNTSMWKLNKKYSILNKKELKKSKELINDVNDIAPTIVNYIPKQKLVSFKEKFNNFIQCIKPKTIKQEKLYPNTFETSYQSRKFDKNQFNIFNKTVSYILYFTIALVLVSIIMIFVVGINSTLLGDQGFRIIVSSADYNILMSQGLTFSNVVLDNGNYYCYLSSSLSDSQINDLLQKITTFKYQTVIGQTSLDLIKLIMISLSVSYAFVIVYTIIRCNWTSIIPMAIGCLITPIISMGLLSMTTIQFDQNIVYVLIFIFLLNAIMCFNVIQGVNSKWKRRRIYNNDQIRYLINNELKNSIEVYILYFVVYLLFIICFLICTPSTILSSLVLLVLTLIPLIIVPFIVVPFALYWSLTLRLNISNPGIANNNSRYAKNNLDLIDEQLILGINQKEHE